MTWENGDMSAQPHGRADLLRDLQAGENQCTARSKRTGNRCRRPSALGSNVCRSHGSEAPQTRAKAQRRLQQAADVLVQRLLSLALDGDTPDNVALSAIIAALDRAGLSVKTTGTLEVSVKPFERVFDAITAGPRDPEQPALEAPNDEDRLDAEAIDVEIVYPDADPSLGLDAEDAEIVDAGVHRRRGHASTTLWVPPNPPNRRAFAALRAAQPRSERPGDEHTPRRERADDT